MYSFQFISSFASHDSFYVSAAFNSGTHKIEDMGRGLPLACLLACSLAPSLTHSLTHSTHSLISWSRVLEKLIGLQLVKKFPTFLGI